MTVQFVPKISPIFACAWSEVKLLISLVTDVGKVSNKNTIYDGKFRNLEMQLLALHGKRQVNIVKIINLTVIFFSDSDLSITPAQKRKNYGLKKLEQRNPHVQVV